MDPASSNSCVSQRQFDPLYASDAENLRVVGAKLEEVRHCRHYMKVPMSVQQEPGIVSRLFVVCTQSLQCITQAADPTLLPKRDLNALRRSFSTLLLWGEGYGAQTGALDSKLKRSRHLYCTTLSLLRSLCGILEHGLVEIVPHKSDHHKTLALRATCRDLYDESARLLRYIRQKEHKNMSNNARPDDSSAPIDENSDKDSDEGSDTDTDEEVKGSDDQTKLSWFASFVADVSLYMSCLTDLGTALEFPALHHEHNVETEPVVLCANHVAIETHSPMGDKRAESAPVSEVCESRHPNMFFFTETVVTMAGTRIPVDAAELKNMENQQTPLQPAVPVSGNWDDLQPFSPNSLLNQFFEEYYTRHDFEDGPTPELSTSANTSSTERHVFKLDVESPDPWMSGMYDDRLSFDVGVSDHLESLGAKMLPVESGAFDTYLSNFETTKKQMGGDLVYPKEVDATPDCSLPLPHGAICDSPDVDNTLKCKEVVCQCSVQGFSIQKELDAHIGITNLDNSLNFAPESVTDLLGVDEETGGADADATAPTPVAEPVSASTITHLQQYSSDFARPMYPPFKPADRYPPCNTLYVGNLPIDTSEDELKAVFSKQRGYKRLCFRIKHDRPMCFVEFEDTSLATKALNELYGYMLHNSIKRGMRLSFSKSSLGERSGSHTGLTPRQPTTAILSSSILASYGLPHDLRERILRPVNACAWEQHGREVTRAGYRSYGGKAAIAMVQKDGDRSMKVRAAAAVAEAEITR